MPRLTVSAAEHISNCFVPIEENNYDDDKKKKNKAEIHIEMK